MKNFISYKLKKANPLSEKQSCEDGYYNIDHHNKYTLPYSEECMKKPKSNKELIIRKPFIKKFSNAYISDTPVAFNKNKKLIKESLNSYYEFDESHVPLGQIYSSKIEKFLQKIIILICKIFFLDSYKTFIWQKKIGFRIFSKKTFRRSEIIELDNDFEYLLAFDYYYYNFTHFCYESYPRFYYYLQQIKKGKSLSNLKIILPPKNDETGNNYNYWNYINPLLDALKIKDEMKLYLQPNKIFKLSNLTLISQIKHNPFLLKKSVNFLLKQYINKEVVHKKFEKIYISTKKSKRRKVENEKELLQMIKPLGFKEVIMEDLNFIRHC